MGIKRIVDIGFWKDEKVIDEFTTDDKLFFLYLLTNPNTTQLGIYKILISQMSFELGFDKETINGLINRFENQFHIIKYSTESHEIAIRNYLRYSIVKGGKPVYDLLVKEVSAVKDRSLIDFILPAAEKSSNPTVVTFCHYLKANDNVKHNDKQKQNDNENDNDIHNDNDNDNEVSYHDTYHDTSTNRRPLYIRKAPDCNY